MLISIHDVTPAWEAETDDLVARLAAFVPGSAFSMLVVPDFWGRAPLARSPRFAAKLRRWADQGVEMMLHGWSHRDEAERHVGLARFKARHLTASEGEFLGLSKAEATRRLRDGRAVLEDAIGRPVTGFVAPAWLYGKGAHEALADERFEVAEDHLRVWSPASGRTLARGPVISWASRSAGRRRSSIAFAAVARYGLKRLPTLRIALHPGDLQAPSLTASIETTIRHAVTGRRCETYRGLLDHASAAASGAAR